MTIRDYFTYSQHKVVVKEISKQVGQPIKDLILYNENYEIVFGTNEFTKAAYRQFVNVLVC